MRGIDSAARGDLSRVLIPGIRQVWRRGFCGKGDTYTAMNKNIRLLTLVASPLTVSSTLSVSVA